MEKNEFTELKRKKYIIDLSTANVNDKIQDIEYEVNFVLSLTSDIDVLKKTKDQLINESSKILVSEAIEQLNFIKNNETSNAKKKEEENLKDYCLNGIDLDIENLLETKEKLLSVNTALKIDLIVDELINIKEKNSNSNKEKIRVRKSN